MFGNGNRVAELERQVKELKDKLYKVEAANEPIHFGPFPRCLWGDHRDPRSSVSHNEAIRLLMEHCGVELKKIDGTPEQIVLEKKPKPTVTVRLGSRTQGITREI